MSEIDDINEFFDKLGKGFVSKESLVDLMAKEISDAIDAECFNKERLEQRIDKLAAMYGLSAEEVKKDLRAIRSKIYEEKLNAVHNIDAEEKLDIT